VIKENKLKEEKRKAELEKIKSVFLIKDIKQINSPDGLTCILEIPIVMPEGHDGEVNIEDKVEPNEYEVEETDRVSHFEGGTKEVIFESLPLYLNRIVIITAKVSGCSVEKEFVIK